MDDLTRFCCRNFDCPDYAKRGGENLSVRFRYGTNEQFRMLYCSTCQERFSERKGTPLFAGRLPEEKVVLDLETPRRGLRGSQNRSARRRE